MLIPPAGAFVGRTREREALARLVSQGERLMTVLGGPGIGKTRLVTEWGQAAEAQLLSDGISLRFCDLTESRTIDAACESLAKALGVSLPAGASALEVTHHLARFIGELGPTILILDNLEQLACESARLLDPMLAAAPQLRMVVTSRERLRLRAEHCLVLEPLGLPSVTGSSEADVRSSEAVELFYARAGQGRTEAVTEADVAAVAEIVRRLDGIPLAIELCAARAAVLRPAQLLERLSRRFDLLTRGAREAPGRHSTLRNALAWSSEILTPVERVAFAQCSVFRGGFSIHAAEAVLEVSEDVLDVLQSLHDKSLLRLDEPWASSALRFRMFESVREFAEELLDRDASRELIARHSNYFLGAPGSALPEARSSGERVDLDNLTIASERALSELTLGPAQVDASLRAMLLLEPFYLGSARGRLEPFVNSLDLAIAASNAETDQRLLARAIHTRAMADFVRGRIVDCIVGFQRSLDVARSAGARVEEGLSLTKLALFMAHADHADAATELFQEAASIVAATPDAELAGDLALMRAGALIWQGRSDESLSLLASAIEQLSRSGSQRSLAMAEGQLALARLNVGEPAEAEVLLERALARVDGLDEERTQGYLLGIFGRVLHAQGRYDEAKASLDNALEIHRAVGDRWSEGVHLGFAGHLALERRELAEARELYNRALLILADTGERHYVSIYRSALAAVDTMMGDAEGGRAHGNEAMSSLAGIGVGATRRSVRLYSAVVEIAAMAAGFDAHPERADGPRAHAQAVLDDAEPALASRSLDVRVAESVLQRALELQASPRREHEGDASEVSAIEWVVGPDARWFKSPGGSPVSLLRSRGLRLILLRLTRERVAHPGAALTIDDLFKAGWPGERAIKKAAANRVYVSLTKLRNLGLRPLILSREDGFLLDHRIPVSAEHDGSARGEEDHLAPTTAS